MLYVFVYLYLNIVNKYNRIDIIFLNIGIYFCIRSRCDFPVAKYTVISSVFYLACPSFKEATSTSFFRFLILMLLVYVNP